MTSPITDPNVKNYFKCGICSLEVKADDAEILAEIYDEHNCSVYEKPHWTENVFSFDSFLIACAIAVILSIIFYGNA